MSLGLFLVSDPPETGQPACNSDAVLMIDPALPHRTFCGLTLGLVGPFQRRGIYLVTGVSLGGAAVLSSMYVDFKFRAASVGGRLLHYLDAETAHGWAIWAAQKGLAPVDGRTDPSSLRTVAWGRTFANPIGASNRFVSGTAVAAADRRSFWRSFVCADFPRVAVLVSSRVAVPWKQS